MDRPAARPPTSVVAGLLLAIILDTFIQITWKTAAGSAPADAGLLAGLGRVLANPWFLAAMLAFAAQLWNWLRVLARADLSYAQPITALSYVTVLGLSVVWLHETISLRQGAGVALILLGVWSISRTPSRTAGAPVPAPPAPSAP